MKTRFSETLGLFYYFNLILLFYLFIFKFIFFYYLFLFIFFKFLGKRFRIKRRYKKQVLTEENEFNLNSEEMIDLTCFKFSNSTIKIKKFIIERFLIHVINRGYKESTFFINILFFIFFILFFFYFLYFLFYFFYYFLII